MKSEPIPSRLRALRKRSGLSQKDLAKLMGFYLAVPVYQHEHSKTVPSLLTAFGYEVVFRVPASEIFPGFFHTVESGIEERLAKLEAYLHESTSKGRAAILTARKLEFLCERRNQDLNK